MSVRRPWTLAAVTAAAVLVLAVAAAVWRGQSQVCALKSVELMALTAGGSIDWMLMNFGDPDFDQSFAPNARSRVARRTLTYVPQLVRATYRARVRNGEPLPFHGWTLVEVTDPTTNTPLEIY
jgi:hypothetical protein